VKIDVEYESIYCQDEKDLCIKVLQFWRQNYPDIMTGWNIDGYDIPYIINRFTKILGEGLTSKLSPLGKIREMDRMDNFGNDVIRYNILGISSLDYIELYKKNTYSSRESYSLDFISNYELDVGKLDYRADGYKDLDDLWDRNPQKYCSYNVCDVQRVMQIDNKNKFIDITLSVAYYAGVNFDDTFSGMRVWDALIHKYLLEQNIVVSPNSSATKTKLPGAYVKPIKPNLYKNLMSYDLNSLYPSIIRTLNIGVESLVPESAPDHNITQRDMVEEIVNESLDLSFLKEHKLSLASNGVMFRNNKQSFLSKLMEMLYEERRQDKNKMLDYLSQVELAKKNGEPTYDLEMNATKYKNMQMVKKILLNSLYGVTGNAHFRWYDIRMASAITLSGQSIIKWAERKMNIYMNALLKTDDDYVVLIDTDSIVVSFDALVQKVGLTDRDKITDFLDGVGSKKIEPFLEKSYKEYADYINSTDNQLEMGRENIASSALLTRKKRYAMKVEDSEGVRFDSKDPYIKIMGLEIVKSSTAKQVQQDIRSCLVMLLDDKPINDIRSNVDVIKNKFFKLEPSVLAFPRGVNNIEKFMDKVSLYTKGTPIAVRASILANHHFNANIKSGDKIKYVMLKLPNPINENVIGFIDDVDESLKKYIDYDLVYNKSFYEPVKSLCESAHKELEQINTLF
jgi:DNA polymerase elongation subunit (family B)